MNHGDCIDLRTPEGRAAARRAGLPVPPDPPEEASTRAGVGGEVRGQEAPRGQQVFINLCRTLGLPDPEFEHRFSVSRKWRFDIAWPEKKVAIEVQGGLFTGGRHVRGAALLREYEKLNHACAAGWAVFLFTPQQIESGEWEPFVRTALEARPC